MPRSPESGSGGGETDERKRILLLEQELEQRKSDMALMRTQLDCVLHERGLECAISDAVGRFETMLEPLKALAPVRDFGALRGAVVALRRSLRRPNFDAPPTNFGEVFDSSGNPKGGTRA